MRKVSPISWTSLAKRNTCHVRSACKVELTDDSVKTPEGLYIGMSRADVEAAMEGYSVETVGVNLSYSTETVMLNVTFRDGYVSGIIYVAK